MKDGFAATREQVRELDRIAIEEYEIDGLILMENAGRRAARVAAQMLDGADGRRVLILCGKGNNGGDGFVVARHLTNWGAQAQVLLLAKVAEVMDRADESAANCRIALRMGIQIHQVPLADDVRAALQECSAHLWVDAMLGTGISGQVREPFATAIEALNARREPVLAIDVPSGLDCNSGQPLGMAVRADRTVTFALNKLGFETPTAADYTGPVEVAEISIPRAAIERKIEEWESGGRPT